MLYKGLGFITSFGNLAIVSALYYNNTIFQFGTDNWNIALGSMVFLSLLSTIFFWFNNPKEGESSLKVYGSFYAVFSVFVYAYASFKNLFYNIDLEEFFGLFAIFIIFLSISTLSILVYKNQQGKKVILLITSMFSILTVLLSFSLIYKYIFLLTALKFDHLVLELFTIFLGSVLFIIPKIYSEKSI